MAHPHNDTPPHFPEKRLTFFIAFLWFFLLLGVFYSGHLYSNDAVSKISSAQNLILHGSPYIDLSSGAWGLTGNRGRVFSHFSLGSVALMVPPVAIWLHASELTGNRLPAVTLGALVTGFTLLYSALIGALLYALLRTLLSAAQEKTSTVAGVAGSRVDRKAFLFANIFIFATMLFPYAKTDWSEPAAFLFGLSGFAILFAQWHHRDHRAPLKIWVLWCICVAGASLIRMEYLLFFALFAAVDAVYRRGIKSHHLAAAGMALLVIFANSYYNYYRYDTFFNFGYVGQQNQSRGVLESVGGLAATAVSMLFNRDTPRYAWWFFLSFGKNCWFWAAPLLALSFLTFRYWKGLSRPVRMLFLAGVIYLPIHVYLINTASWCCTTWCWSFRYFYVTLPYLLLPIAFFPYEKKWLRTGLIVLTIAGASVSLVASLTNFHVILERQVDAKGFTETMWGKTNTLAGAPFWSHTKQLCRQMPATISLAVKKQPDKDWDHLRLACLDIWPVGLSAAGASPWVAFALWLAWCAGVAAYGGWVIRPRWRNDRGASL
jgi:hypothetical protein